jgi:hypothetical protein
MIIPLCIDILPNDGTLVKIYRFSFVKQGNNHLGMRKVVKKF